MLGIAELFASLDRHELALAVVVNRKAVRVAAVAAGTVSWRHGLAMYGYGCRCDTCRMANTLYMRAHQRRRAGDPVFRAQRRGYDRKRRGKAGK